MRVIAALVQRQSGPQLCLEGFGLPA